MHRIIEQKDNKYIISIYYSFKDIQEEVFKRTSMLARGENSVRYNELVMSKGEDFMFTPYLNDISSELYDYISAFCKIPNTGLFIDSKTEVCSDEYNINALLNDIEINIEKKDWFNESSLGMLDVAIFEALVNGIIWQWLSIFGENDLSAKYNAMYQKAIVNMRNRLNSQKGPVHRKYHLF